MTQTMQLKSKRGDSIELTYNNLKDQDGAALDATDFDIRSALKLQDDTADNDSAALAVITDGAGITVNSATSITLLFPASATNITPQWLKFDVQFTDKLNAERVITPLDATVEMESDSTRTSP